MKTGAKEKIHSSIGASSMERWAACPGSVKLSSGLPKQTSSYAEEGTRAHELAEQAILNGFEFPMDADPEMVEHLKVYLSALEADCSPDSKMIVEQSFDLSKVHPGLYGTCDAIIFDSEQKVLKVYDLKYGKGIPVEVEGNKQLMYYGLGALLSTNFSCKEIELVVVQPRCFHPDGPVRRWRFPVYEILEFESDLKSAALETEKKDAALVPGDHCRFCPASGICPVIKNKSMELCKQEFAPIAQTPNAVFDPVKLAEVMEWLPMIEDWAHNVREFAYAQACAGKKIPGWKLVEKRATRRWINTDEAAIKLQREFTTDIYREFFEKPGLKSPAQIEKIVPKELHEKILSPLIIAQSSGNKLVPIHEKGAEIIIADAKSEFELADLLN